MLSPTLSFSPAGQTQIFRYLPHLLSLLFASAVLWSVSPNLVVGGSGYGQTHWAECLYCGSIGIFALLKPTLWSALPIHRLVRAVIEQGRRVIVIGLEIEMIFPLFPKEKTRNEWRKKITKKKSREKNVLITTRPFVFAAFPLWLRLLSQWEGVDAPTEEYKNLCWWVGVGWLSYGRPPALGGGWSSRDIK